MADSAAVSAFPDYSADLHSDCCRRCGRVWQTGDYPFCNGSPEDHEHPHYTFTWGAGGPFTKKGA